MVLNDWCGVCSGECCIHSTSHILFGVRIEFNKSIQAHTLFHSLCVFLYMYALTPGYKTIQMYIGLFSLYGLQSISPIDLKDAAMYKLTTGSYYPLTKSKIKPTQFVVKT